ncbi:hypothetical protein [Ferrimonas senticii]|uniref:hypothetical protein n=1 Tax=Ferrimonas senticii TaxID=394566 RepID=UPI0004071AA1|nr:hypothetical protein [Ferrimonas senticii]
MRYLPLSMAALLLSSAAFASSAGCQSQSSHSDRLACYDQMADAISSCQSKSDKLERLECYDNINSLVRDAFSRPAPQATTTSTTATTIAPEVDAEARFGNENKAIAASKTLDAISATVEKIANDPYGKWTLTLTNGQRWKQTDSSNLKVRRGDSVTIERASLGSFLLSREGSNKRVRVKRL